MSNKVRTFFPSYQLRTTDALGPINSRDMIFQYSYQGVRYVCKMPWIGSTATQKAALEWASLNTYPVISISHEKPTEPDKMSWVDPSEAHRQYYPYAMAIATLMCLGETSVRRVKVYFCQVELHEENHLQKVHSSGKETYVVPL